jgi:hypothetical protein
VAARMGRIERLNLKPNRGAPTPGRLATPRHDGAFQRAESARLTN